MLIMRRRLVRKLLPLSLNNRYLSKALGIIFPMTTFQEVNAWPQSTGFPWTDRRVTMCWSFDCDIPEDTESLPALCNLLKEYDLPASFAVIGELLKKNPEPYEKVMKQGFEIINHGYSQHNLKDKNGVWEACLFYNALTTEQIEQEISQNQELIHRYLGIHPDGFRTPHFGTFQRHQDIEVLHAILFRQGIAYSSSTQILSAKMQRLLNPGRPVVEVPFSSRVGTTQGLFDSWTFLGAPKMHYDPRGFMLNFQRIMKCALSSMKPIFLNFYFDPNHVVSLEEFRKCMDLVSFHRDDIWIGKYSKMVSCIRN